MTRKKKQQQPYTFHYLGKRASQVNYQPIVFAHDAHVFHTCHVLHSFLEPSEEKKIEEIPLDLISELSSPT